VGTVAFTIVDQSPRLWPPVRIVVALSMLLGQRSSGCDDFGSRKRITLTCCVIPVLATAISRDRPLRTWPSTIVTAPPSCQTPFRMMLAKGMSMALNYPMMLMRESD
jgi:hypothetical protein